MKALLLVASAALLLGCESGAHGPVPSGDGGAAAAAQLSVELAPVLMQALDTTTQLEGELAAFEDVAIRARANGFVTKVLVDRGSAVKAGQLLVTVDAPELAAQRAEVEARLLVEKSTFDRLKAAAATPGAVALSEVDVSEATFHADEARLRSLKAMEGYLTVTAPFDGVVTERTVHPGALVGPQAAGAAPMLRLQQVSRLRLTVAVPEAIVGAVLEGASASFTVRAFPGEKFSGTVRRISHALEVKTRAMPIELDVENQEGKLAPGMFATVSWPVRRAVPTAFVPASAIVQSTEKTYVARVHEGVVDPVPVQRGLAVGELVEVFGALGEGDLVARRGSEELRAGTRVTVRPAGKR